MRHHATQAPVDGPGERPEDHAEDAYDGDNTHAPHLRAARDNEPRESIEQRDEQDGAGNDGNEWQPSVPAPAQHEKRPHGCREDHGDIARDRQRAEDRRTLIDISVQGFGARDAAAGDGAQTDTTCGRDARFGGGNESCEHERQDEDRDPQGAISVQSVAPPLLRRH